MVIDQSPGWSENYFNPYHDDDEDEDDVFCIVYDVMLFEHDDDPDCYPHDETCSWSFLQACPTTRGRHPRPQSGPPALRLSFFLSFQFILIQMFISFMRKLVLSQTLKWFKLLHLLLVLIHILNARFRTLVFLLILISGVQY